MSPDTAANWATALHDEATNLFESLDGGGIFVSTEWTRSGGGGGVSRLMLDGRTFEKAGINRSVVHGAAPDGVGHFFAAGVSLVAHPWNPHLPTVHLNVRYLERAAEDGAESRRWFGGGTDLTPTWPHPEDAVHFHRTLRKVCDRHHEAFYPRFKGWCDAYFVNAHRAAEPRGVGGIFFDDLEPGAEGLSENELLEFATDVGQVLADAYAPLVARRRDMAATDADRALQLQRRGRYAEFNLVHDRGTRFGLQTAARIDSVLMSLPPVAAWPGADDFPAGSAGAKLLAMLEPRDWANGWEPGTH